MTEIENKITNLLNPTQSYVVALSGGVDSSVLLHIVHSYTSNVRSVFVNHNQKDSDKLQKSAESFAKDLGEFGITVNMVSGGLLKVTDASAAT